MISLVLATWLLDIASGSLANYINDFLPYSNADVHNSRITERSCERTHVYLLL